MRKQLKVLFLVGICLIVGVAARSLEGRVRRGSDTQEGRAGSAELKSFPWTESNFASQWLVVIDWRGRFGWRCGRGFDPRSAHGGGATAFWRSCFSACVAHSYDFARRDSVYIWRCGTEGKPG